MVTVSLRITDTLNQVLESEADDRGVSKSDIIRGALLNLYRPQVMAVIKTTIPYSSLQEPLYAAQHQSPVALGADQLATQ